jgi:hypothetical protein
MKSLFFTILFSVSSLFISNSHAAGFRYRCAVEEINAVLNNKNLNAAVVTSGDIQSVVMTQSGYVVTTSKCEIQADIEYTATDENRPCTVFKAVIKNIHCN